MIYSRQKLEYPLCIDHDQFYFYKVVFFLICKLVDFFQELEELQASVDKATEELDEKVRQFDQARDSELDNIEFEKDSLQERQRQDR